MNYFIQLVVSGIVLGSIYALIALGFVLIYKATRVLNFAQGELLMAGAYIAFALTVQLHISFWSAFFIAMLLCALLGFIIEILILKPLIGEPIISIVMITIGLSIVLKAVVEMVWGTETRVYPAIFSTQPITLGAISVSKSSLFSLGAAITLFIIFHFFFKFSSTGIAMRAVADDQQAAQSMGINIKKIFAISWMVAALVAGIGGILIGNMNGINVSLGMFGLKVFPAVILGGLDSVPGAIIGGITIGVLESLSGGYLDPLVGGGVKMVAPFVILLVILLIKPYGLFGTEEIEKV